ncbi:MAG: Phospholipase D/Transphosphatidylase [Nitrospirae bacterium]|nr:Phospholipase D/Transphosphatidylase [Nitrospirota bacterium]
MPSIRLLKNGTEVFPAMFDAIDRAVSCVVLEMYIYADDGTGREVRGRLVNAVRRGIRVMVLVDAVGSWSLSEAFWDELRNAGGMVRRFRPVSRGMFLFRNHRKLLLVDDRTAFIGGLNIADEYFRGSGGELPWRDNALEIRGREVMQLRRSFDRMWARADLPIRRAFFRSRHDREGRETAAGRLRFLESGPENPMHPVRRVYRQLIRGSAAGIDLAMGYFYPHGGILRALKRAVNRGVRVRLLFPRKSDIPMARWAARGLYGRLLRSGMEVWEYRPSMMHAKLAIVDDTLIAGSANLDIRSGRINYELVAVVNDRELARRARSDFEEDLMQAERITLEAWKARPFMQKIKERISYWLLARLDIFFAKAEMARLMR